MKILTPVSGNHWAVPDCYHRGMVKAGADVVTYDVGEAPVSLAGRAWWSIRSNTSAIWKLISSKAIGWKPTISRSAW